VPVLWGGGAGVVTEAAGRDAAEAQLVEELAEPGHAPAVAHSTEEDPGPFPWRTVLMLGALVLFGFGAAKVGHAMSGKLNTAEAAGSMIGAQVWFTAAAAWAAIVGLWPARRDPNSDRPR
jgi:hypothetical protein